MAEVVITEFMDERAVDLLRQRYDVTYHPDLWEQPPELTAAVAAARGLVVRNRTQVDAALLQAAPDLQVVGRLGVGLDNIDLPACRRRQIAVKPATGANAVAVAEYVLAAALLLRRGAFLSSERIAAGEWPRTELVGRELSGATLGLIGLGTIARQVADRGRALGMRIAAHDPFLSADDPAWSKTARHTELPALLADADIVSIHVPYTDSTANLIDAAAVEHMGPDGVLINTARGGIVDEGAVVAALRSGRLAGAALDVFATEPLREDAAARFAEVPNLILTPHIAGVTEESNRAVSLATAEHVIEVLG